MMTARLRFLSAPATISEAEALPAFTSTATGWCLDQEYPRGYATTGVGAYPCNGGANQRWRLAYDPVERAATLVNAASGWCLDQEYPYGRATHEVGAYPCNGGDNQVWSLT